MSLSNDHPNPSRELEANYAHESDEHANWNHLQPPSGLSVSISAQNIVHSFDKTARTFG
jgi:hypothetical protein